MLAKLQIWLEPYLGFFGGSVWLQALVVIVASQLVARIFDRVICAAIKKLTTRTQFSFDDYLIDHLHRPIYFTLMLIGLALAVSLLQLQLGEAFEQIIFSVLWTIIYIIWSLFLACTLGAGVLFSIWVNTVWSTLGGLAISANASVSSVSLRFLLCSSCTLGDAVGSARAMTSTSLCLFAASVNIVSNRFNASNSSSHMLFGL